MPESLSPEHQALVREARDFAESVMLPNADAADARQIIRAGAKQRGFFQMTQPEAFGGSAAGQLALTVVRENLARYNPPHLEAVFGPSPGVLGGVEGPLRDSHLKPMLAGEKRGSFGFTEPDDAPQPTTGWLEGDVLRVRGQKSYVTGGGDADYVNTLVQIDGKGPSMVVIDTTLPGVELVQRFSSLDGSHHAAFKFNDVPVPIHHIIGEPGQGMPKAMRQIGDTRMLFAAQASGYMLYVMQLLNEHLKAADRSGEPRGNKDVVRWHYANLRIKAYAGRSMLYRTARLAEAGENIVNEAMACKAFTTEAVGEIVDTAIQLVGGVALVEGHPLLDLYKKVRAWRLAEGASDILRLNIGRGILELDKGRI